MVLVSSPTTWHCDSRPQQGLQAAREEEIACSAHSLWRPSCCSRYLPPLAQQPPTRSQPASERPTGRLFTERSWQFGIAFRSQCEPESVARLDWEVHTRWK